MSNDMFALRFCVTNYLWIKPQTFSDLRWSLMRLHTSCSLSWNHFKICLGLKSSTSSVTHIFLGGFISSFAGRLKTSALIMLWEPHLRTDHAQRDMSMCGMREREKVSNRHRGQPHSYNLILKVTSLHLYHNLYIRSKSMSLAHTEGMTLYKAVNQDAGIVEDHLRGCPPTDIKIFKRWLRVTVFPPLW